MTISAVAAVLIAALAVYAFLTTGATHADSTFGAQTVVKFCNDLPTTFSPDPSFNGSGGTCSEAAEPAGAGLNPGPAGHPKITTQLTIPKGDMNFSNVVTMAPNNEPIVSGTTMLAGEKIGALHSDTTLGTLNNACTLTLGVDFIFFNVKLPEPANETVSGDPRTSNIITYPQPQGTTDRFGAWSAPGPATTSPGPFVAITPGVVPADGTAASTNNAIQGYPSYLLDAFDPDLNALTGADGPAKPLVPLAVYGGISDVVGSWIPLYFVQFSSGQLTALSGSPLRLITAALGQPSVAVLNDPTEAPSPSSISDFCSYLRSTTMLLGVSSPNSVVRVTNPTTAGTTQYFVQYAASQRDTEQDSNENQIDTCPKNRNVGDVRVLQGPTNGDADSDGIDNACDGVSNAGITDQDSDGYSNRQDNCPQVSNGATAVPTFTPNPTGSPPVVTPTQPADLFQKESELGNAGIGSPAPDNGPGTDGMGDLCDSGTVGVNQNNMNGAGSAPSPAPTINIALSATVANGRYMTATNLVAKCIGGPDLDGDGYCNSLGADSFDAATGHNAARHSQWSGATHPALQMDTDLDKVSDTRESWMSQCSAVVVTPAVVPFPTCGAGEGTPSARQYGVTPAPSATPGYDLGSDAAKSCAQTTIAKDEGPWDNWSFDFDDNGTVNGTDFLTFGLPFGKTVDVGLINNSGFKMGWVAIYRFDLNADGIVNGTDFLLFSPVFGKTCAAALIPAFSQQ